MALYIIWVIATYLLEGRSLTLLRPEATGARFAYAFIANIVIGTAGAGLVVQSVVWETRLAPPVFGLCPPGRTLLSITLALILGLTVFFLQRPATLSPVVLANAFSQVWLVSVAEVLVCWAVLGKALETMNKPRSWWSRVFVAAVTAAVTFGLYHFAHSPPFNTAVMVGLLTVVGLATSGFFFTVRELYGTIVFHNFMAMKGVTDVLAAGGRIDHFSALQLPLVFSAVVGTGVLIAVDLRVRRRAAAMYG